MDSLIETFHIDWKLMAAQAINFAVVLVVLWRFALRPLKKLMDERAKTIEGGLNNASKQQELLAAQKAEYDAVLVRARGEAAGIMKEVKKDADAKREELLAEAKQKSLVIFEEGKQQLVNEREKMIAEAKAELADIVVAATERVLEGLPVAGIDRALVDKALENRL